MHWNLRGAAKQEAQPSPATYSREDSTSWVLATVDSVHISCNDSPPNLGHIMFVILLLLKSTHYIDTFHEVQQLVVYKERQEIN